MNSVAFHTRHAGGHDPARIVFVLATAVLLAFSSALAELDERARVALFALAVLLLGLPHGALDVPVSRALGLWRDGRGFVRFVALYVAVAAGALLLWLAVPVVGFTVLLALSAAHFRHDWSGIAGPVGGIGIIGWPAFWNEAETAAIFALFTGPQAGAALANAASWAGAAALAALVPTAIAAWRRYRDRGLDRDRGRDGDRGPKSTGAGDVGELALLALLAAALHPLLFFAAYFCALHAPRHTGETLRRHGPLVRRTAPGVVGCAAAAAGGILLASLVAAKLGVWPDLPDALVVGIFAGLLCLTVPHVLLVERLET